MNKDRNQRERKVEGLKRRGIKRISRVVRFVLIYFLLIPEDVRTRMGKWTRSICDLLQQKVPEDTCYMLLVWYKYHLGRDSSLYQTCGSRMLSYCLKL